MRCPVCGTEDPTPAEFCASCGAPLPHPAEPPQARTEAPVGVTPTTAPVPRAYPAPSAYPPPAAHATSDDLPIEVQERRFKNILGAVIVGVLAVAIVGGGIAAYVLTRDKDENDPRTTSKKEEGKALDIRTERGFETSLDALSDAGTQYYGEDAEWWYYPLVEEDDIAEYWLGTNDGEWERGVIVEARDGEWFVSDTYTVDPQDVEPEDPAEGDVTAEEAAAWALNEFIISMYEGRYEDMMAVTSSPLSEFAPEELVEIFAPADLTDFEITGAEAYDDGTAIVAFTLGYSDGTYYEIGAICTLGDDGYYYVSDIGELEGEEGDAGN
jgi:hypothetical protein